MPLFRRNKTGKEGTGSEHVFDSYASRLGVIGKQLDDEGCRSIVVMEMSGNFILKGVHKRNATMSVSEVVSDDFDRGSKADFSRSRPTSYARMLAAIGRDLDERIAANVAVIERTDSFEVIGLERGETRGQLSYVHFNQRYDRAGLVAFVEQNN